MRRHPPDYVVAMAKNAAATRRGLSGELHSTDTRYAARIDRQCTDSTKTRAVVIRTAPDAAFRATTRSTARRDSTTSDGLKRPHDADCRPWANQAAQLATAAAYVLMAKLRLRAAGTACDSSRRGYATDCSSSRNRSSARSTGSSSAAVTQRRHGSASPSHCGARAGSPSVPPHASCLEDDRPSPRSCRHAGSTSPARPHRSRNPLAVPDDGSTSCSGRHALSIPNIELQE